MKIKFLGKLLVCLLFVLVNCCNISYCNEPSTESVRSFVNGKTHQRYIKKAFGIPDYIAKVGNKKNGFTEQWIYKKDTSKSKDVNFMIFEFDENNILVNHGYIDKKVLKKLLAKDK